MHKIAYFFVYFKQNPRHFFYTHKNSTIFRFFVNFSENHMNINRIFVIDRQFITFFYISSSFAQFVFLNVKTPAYCRHNIHTAKGSNIMNYANIPLLYIHKKCVFAPLGANTHFTFKYITFEQPYGSQRRNPFIISSSASFSVNPSVISFISCSPAIFPIAAS